MINIDETVQQNNLVIYTRNTTMDPTRGESGPSKRPVLKRQMLRAIQGILLSQETRWLIEDENKKGGENDVKLCETA